MAPPAVAVTARIKLQVRPQLVDRLRTHLRKVLGKCRGHTVTTTDICGKGTFAPHGTHNAYNLRLRTTVPQPNKSMWYSTMELWILNQLRNKNQKWCVLVFPGFSNFLAFFLPCQRRYVGKYTTAKCPWWTNLWRCVWIAVSWRRRWRGKKEDKKIRAPGKNIVKVILKQRAACSLTTPRATHILHTYTWREPYTIFIQNKLKAQFDTLLCIRIVKDENSNLAK